METGATTSKQEICGSAMSAATGPSSTSSLTGEPKYLSFCPLTAQALNVTILFDWIATPNARSLGQQLWRECERREQEQQSVGRDENKQSKCIKCFESISLCANMVNQTIRTMYQDPRFVHPIQLRLQLRYPMPGRQQVLTYVTFCDHNFWLTYHWKLNARVLDARAERTRQRRNADESPHCPQTPSPRPETPRPETPTLQDAAASTASKYIFCVFNDVAHRN